MYTRPARRFLARGRRTFFSPSYHRTASSLSLRYPHSKPYPYPDPDFNFRSNFHNTPIPWASRKVTQTFKLADIGEGITECEVIKWSINPPAHIQAFDPLCEVQSDKASVEITSPVDGVVTKLLVSEGSIAKVGEGLCLIETEEEINLDSVTEPKSQSVSASPVAEKQTHLSSVHLQAEQSPRRLHPLDPNHTSSPASVGVSESSTVEVLAAPSVRHFSRQKGVDLGGLMPGSGKGGRVERRDVEHFLARPGEGALGMGTDKEDQLGDTKTDVVVELGRTRYGMWKAMTKSLEIPHFGYTTTLDITTLHNLLPTLNLNIPSHFLPASSQPPYVLVNPSAIYPAPAPPQVPESQQYTRLTYLPVLLKTLSKAMTQWPLFRSSISPSPPPTSNPSSPPKPTLTLRPHADIGIALSTPSGLYTPTLPRVDTQSIYDLASSLQHVAYLGRQTPSGLTPKEMPRRGSTVTVSNVGAVGKGEGAMPVLVPGGGVAIVALGRAKWVWDVDGEFWDESKGKTGERRLKLIVSWSADHRVVEGAELAAFVECWRGYVESPERLIAEGV